MAKIKFDIKYRKEIEEGKYSLYTLHQLPVRILCWDLNNDKYPIVGVVEYENGHEEIRTFTSKGFYNAYCTKDSIYNLYIETNTDTENIEENNTFKEILLQCCQEYSSKYDEGFTKYYIDEMLDKYEKKLKRIAYDEHIRKVHEQVQECIKGLFGDGE